MEGRIKEHDRRMSYASQNIKLLLRALHHRNFRLFYCGQAISLIGTWTQRVAIGWLVYRLTGSVFMLGLVGFLGDLPFFLVAPFAGVMADRWNQQRILIVIQTLAMVQASILAVLVLTGSVEVWHVIALSIFLGLVHAFDVPVRQSFLPALLEKREDLGNAIALNSSMVHGARLIGPSLAGILIAATGEGICFLLNAVSYVAVIAALIAMKISPKEKPRGSVRVLQELKEGFSYVSHSVPIRSILLLLGVVSLVAMPYQVLMPVFAQDILLGGPRTFGFLVGCSGLGALAGAVYLASRKSVPGLERLLAIAAGVFGIGLIAFSFSRILWLSFFIMLFTGFGMMIQMASSNTVLQSIVDDNMRGRMMGFYAMAYRGMVPLGSLLAGVLAGKIGAPGTLLLGGVCCVSGAVLFASKLPYLRKAIHPIYVKMGFLSDAGSGMQKPGIPKAIDVSLPSEE